jgi:PIN domain nuclease of toxin-antitoxin system
MSDSARLNSKARSLIQNADEVFISSASIWEIAIKWRIGKIEEDPQIVVDQIQNAGLRDLHVTNCHAVTAGKLPLYHHDPFDRLLVAQAVSEPMRLLTVDAKLAEYSELVIVI